MQTVNVFGTGVLRQLLLRPAQSTHTLDRLEHGNSTNRLLLNPMFRGSVKLWRYGPPVKRGVLDDGLSLVGSIDFDAGCLAGSLAALQALMQPEMVVVEPEAGHRGIIRVVKLSGHAGSCSHLSGIVRPTNESSSDCPIHCAGLMGHDPIGVNLPRTVRGRMLSYFHCGHY